MDAHSRIRASVLLLLALSGPAWPAGHDLEADPSAARLAWKSNESQLKLVGVSPDGQWLLIKHWRAVKCKSSKRRACALPVLAVYSSAAGHPTSELVGSENENFSAAAFADSNIVTAVESVEGEYRRIRWDISARTIDRVAVDGWKGFSPRCRVAGNRVLGFVYSTIGTPVLAMADREVRLLEQPSFVQSRDLDCNAWVHDDAVLLEMGERPTGLYSVSATGKPYTKCFTPDEHLFQHAISPDGSRVVLIVGSGETHRDRNVMAPAYKTTLIVLSASACEVLHRFPLTFPEPKSVSPPLAAAKKDRYLVNALLIPVFAKSVAISPDNSVVAFSYGVRTGRPLSDSIAYVRLHSLKDGRRLATFRGDVLRNNFWITLRQDGGETLWAPAGTVLFSPDSSSLYLESERLRRWDVSGLQ